MSGRTARWSDLLEMARHAAAIGVDSLWLPDHVLFVNEGIEPQGVPECWSLLSALAATTTRVELGPFVCCTGFRNPALLAKTVATVDEISAGRLILGLGAGWHEPEYQAYGYPFDHRVSRFEEAIAILAGLLRDGHADVQGRYHEARDAELCPRGPRPHGPPIMIGTSGERMLDLTARYADVWNAFGRNRPAEIAPLRERVDAACVRAGRDPATLARSAGMLMDLPGARERERRPRTTSPPLAGSPEELAATLRAYAAEGIFHVQLLLNPNTPAGLDALAPVLESLDAG